MRRVVALFSGGLDSTLAIRILQEQQFEVEALNIRTTFDCCRVPAADLAAALGVRLTVLSVAEDYVDIIKHPRFGYGKGANPCLDCRIYMARMAKRFMQQTESCAVVTGEILGQRPMSQKRRDLDAVARHSGLEHRLLRPLSAKLLPPTIPEEEGLVDRERLYGFQGRTRRPLVELARQLGIDRIPTPSTGCALTESTFAARAFDLIEFDAGATAWDFELLNVGRHFRFDPHTKIVVGRDANENAALEQFFRRSEAGRSAWVHPHNFLGADALIVGTLDQQSYGLAGTLVVRYSRQATFGAATVEVHARDSRQLVQPEPNKRAFSAIPL